MKVKYLKRRLAEVQEKIETHDEDSFVNDDAISEISSVFSAFVTEAQLRLQDINPLGVEDYWLLDVFSVCRMDADFNAAFERICVSTFADFDQLYALSCSFFYRQHIEDPHELTSLDRYREIMGRVVSEDVCERLIAKLRKFGVLR
ncbi:hypothetical protein SAMN04488030_0028 [Aliiroseovarius halocynthiae]|uniref:Uncharacterized protein n=1 Tax=Aliiroseovarius halocynthiae TaxID=985055 RepID=A0A545SLC4_9RHOB|nr:hypothetical protein [Aliiroseovarius halocynthiae]TQV65787.1 hypothetical protein FIL88_15930 [Aliiroseovarius halocynthiae]SMR83552.1 hypothetical protein SAMN04488030_0028 [Aliiroseovarius halocynthiae]